MGVQGREGVEGEDEERGGGREGLKGGREWRAHRREIERDGG